MCSRRPKKRYFRTWETPRHIVHTETPSWIWGCKTREWTYHGNRPSLNSLVTVLDSVRYNEEFRRAIQKRFPIFYRDFGEIRAGTECVAVPRVASVLFALLGLVIFVGVTTFTVAQSSSCAAKESIETGGKERRSAARLLMLLAHPFRSAKLLPISTDWDRCIATTVLTIWSALVAGNVLIARLTYEPASPPLSGIGLVAEVLLIA